MAAARTLGGRSPRGSADRNGQTPALTPAADTSLPARERGSKRKRAFARGDSLMSLPARERGSKLGEHEARSGGR